MPSEQIAHQLNTPPAGTPLITDTPSVDQELTVSTANLADANGLGDFSYQWHRGERAVFSPSNRTAIADATTPNYTPTDFDRGQYLRVVVSYTDGAGFPERLISLVAQVALTDICTRTMEVRDAIVTAIARSTDCAQVTEAQLSELTGTLDLSGDLTTPTPLMAHDFANLASLEGLNLSGNAISALPDGLFRDLRSLTSLQLSNTALTSLSSSDFASLVSLTSLEITGGDSLAISLPANILASSPNLTQLVLADLGLTSLEAGVFSPLPALTTLDISGNSLSSLPAGIFPPLSALTTLDLGDNSLSSLPAGIFAPLPRPHHSRHQWQHSDILCHPLSNNPNWGQR